MEKRIMMSDLFKVIKEIGEQPGNEKYHPELKEITWMLMDYVKVSANARGNQIPSVTERLMDKPQVLNG